MVAAADTLRSSVLSRPSGYPSLTLRVHAGKTLFKKSFAKLFVVVVCVFITAQPLRLTTTQSIIRNKPVHP